MMRVLVACEFSGVVRNAFSALSHDAWSCDFLPSETNGNHIQADVLDVLENGWDLMIAHPPCTYLSNSGVRHLHDHVKSRLGNRTKVYGQERFESMKNHADFFLKLLNAPIEKIAIENPVPHKYARNIIGKYDQLIQPWQFGCGETKATCLWLKNLPPLMCTVIDQGRIHRIHNEPPSPERWKQRSRFYPGIASAMADNGGV